MYGFQWRHSGAKYKDMHADYTGKGIDQLADVINTIKNNPASRRIIMCAWNPTGELTMNLPPTQNNSCLICDVIVTSLTTIVKLLRIAGIYLIYPL